MIGVLAAVVWLYGTMSWPKAVGVGSVMLVLEGELVPKPTMSLVLGSDHALRFTLCRPHTQSTVYSPRSTVCSGSNRSHSDSGCFVTEI